MKTEKCDLCGAEVRHTHPAWNRETDRECKICCTCQDNSSHPLEDLVKDATPDCTHTRIPCIVDELIDLTDEQLADFYANTGRVRPGAGLEEIIRAASTVKSVARVLDLRGKDYLLEDWARKPNSEK